MILDLGISGIPRWIQQKCIRFRKQTGLHSGRSGMPGIPSTPESNPYQSTSLSNTTNEESSGDDYGTYFRNLTDSIGYERHKNHRGLFITTASNLLAYCFSGDKTEIQQMEEILSYAEEIYINHGFSENHSQSDVALATFDAIEMYTNVGDTRRDNSKYKYSTEEAVSRLASLKQLYTITALKRYSTF